MIPNLVLGLIGGVAATKLVRRWRQGAHRHGWARHRPGFGGAGPLGLWRLFRALDLDASQRQQLDAIFARVKESARALHQASREGVQRAALAVSQEAFDRDAVERTIDERGPALAELRREIVDGLGRVHAILTPEQRAKLARSAGTSAAPEGGPYR